MKSDIILKNTLKAVLTLAAVLAMTVGVHAASLGETIYKSLQNADKSIDVSSFHVTPQAAMDEYFNVVGANPDLFYVDLHVDCKYDMKSGECKELVCTYNTKDVKGDKAKFNGYVTSVAAQAKAYPGKYDQIKFVHDFMVNNFEFNAAGLTAYSLVKDGKGDCTAYTGFFKAVMDKLNIPCKVAISEDMCHEWNVVQLDGKWYNADITWDDPIGGSGVIYSNFLKSDSLIKMGGHFNWKVDGNITCTDTTYDKVG